MGILKADQINAKLSYGDDLLRRAIGRLLMKILKVIFTLQGP